VDGIYGPRSKVRGPRLLLAPPPAHIIGGLEGIRTGRQGIQPDKNSFLCSLRLSLTSTIAHFDYRSLRLPLSELKFLIIIELPQKVRFIQQFPG
jgi:hypothetical protein